MFLCNPTLYFVLSISIVGMHKTTSQVTSHNNVPTHISNSSCCQSGWTSYKTKCYFVQQQSLTFENAKRACTNMSAELAEQKLSGGTNLFYARCHLGLQLHTRYWLKVYFGKSTYNLTYIEWKPNASATASSNQSATHLSICETQQLPASPSSCRQDVQCTFTLKPSPVVSLTTNTTEVATPSPVVSLTTNTTEAAAPAAAVATGNTPISGWTRTYRREYHVNYQLMNHDTAAMYCRTFGGSLILFTSPHHYLNVSGTLNVTSNTSFWVGGGSSDTSCLQLIVSDNRTTIGLSECTYAKYSICSRADDINEIRNDPGFIKLIKEIKIDVKNTTRVRRQHISVWDGRRSAETMGQFGIALIVSIFAFITMCDFPRLVRFCVELRGSEKRRRSVGHL